MRVPTAHKELIDAAALDALDKSIAVTRQLDAEAGGLLHGEEVLVMNAAALLIQGVGAEVMNRAGITESLRAIGAALGFLMTIIPPEQRVGAAHLIGRSMAVSGELKEREDAAVRHAH